MNKNKHNTNITMYDLEPTIEQYKQLCVWALKRIDEEYRTRRKYLPYPQGTLEALLSYVPALVTDGNLTEKEGERITKLIKSQLVKI